MTIQQKIKKVMQEAGCSPTEACEMLGIDVDAVTLASLAVEEKVVTIEEILEVGKISAAKVLVDIVEDTTAENKDRIAAAKIVLTGAGQLPDIGCVNWEERIKRMKIACGEAIDIDVTPANNLLQMAS
jgi:hypothetical protein